MADELFPDDGIVLEPEEDTTWDPDDDDSVLEEGDEYYELDTDYPSPGVEYTPAWNRYRAQYHSLQIIREKLNIRSAENGSLNGMNTWASWGLIPTSRPVINPPGVKTSYADFPGFHGSIDLSEVLTDYPTYGERTGSWEFLVAGYDKKNEAWSAAYEAIMSYCHGKRMKIVFFNEPDYYYLGRIAVNSWKSEKDWSKIVIDYRLEPFRYNSTTMQVDDPLADNLPRDAQGRVIASTLAQAEGVKF